MFRISCASCLRLDLLLDLHQFQMQAHGSFHVIILVHPHCLLSYVPFLQGDLIPLLLILILESDALSFGNYNVMLNNILVTLYNFCMEFSKSNSLFFQLWAISASASMLDSSILWVYYVTQIHAHGLLFPYIVIEMLCHKFSLLVFQTNALEIWSSPILNLNLSSFLFWMKSWTPLMTFQLSLCMM